MFHENDFMTDGKGKSVFRTPEVSDLIIQIEQTTPSCAMNLPLCFKLGQKVDTERLGRAVDRVIAENDVLRAAAVFEREDDGGYGECKVRFLKQYHYEIPLKIISGADKEEKTRNAMDMLNLDLRTRMDIERDIPARIWLYQLDENEYWLAFAVHHYICDPATLSMYAKAVLGYYFAENSAQVFGTDSSFMQYLGEIEDFYTCGEGDRIAEFWKKEYRGYELPKFEEKQVPDLSGMPSGIFFDKANIEKIAKENKTNTFNVIMLIYHIAYTKLYHSLDTSVAFAVNGRKEKRYNTTMGLFIQVVNNRLTFRCGQSLGEVYKQLRHGISVSSMNSSAYTEWLPCTICVSYQVSKQLGTDSMPFEIIHPDMSYLSSPGAAFAIMETDEQIGGSIIVDRRYFSGKDVRNLVDCCMEIQRELIVSEKSRNIDELFADISCVGEQEDKIIEI